MEVEVRVLGATRALRDGAELPLGGRRNADVLALLAAAGGHPVEASVLADQLWRGDPPASASTTLQGYVARLRKVLHADGGPPRLVTVGRGYALRDVAVDAALATALIHRGRSTAEHAPRQAAAALAQALGLWAGDALADVRDIPDLEPEAVRLDELRLTALDAWAEALLAGGAGAEAVPDLGRQAATHPLRESTQALLARVLSGAGRPADALDVLDRLRSRLVEELGVDPSPQVQSLQQQILRHDPSLAAANPAAPPGNADAPAPQAAPGASDFVGRGHELGALERSWGRVAAGRTAAAAVTGEAGIGKTRLVEELARRVGVRPRWGRNPQAAGSPPYWPWQQLLGGLPPVPPDQVGETGRWALGLEVVQRLRALAQQAPQLLVLDDLQWADADSLHLLDVVLAELRDVPVLLVVTCREEAGPAGPVLGRLARTAGALRVDLGGLTADEVALLVAASAGTTLDGAAANALTERTGGNPFYVGELAVLADEAGTAVPAGVRDVLRLRLAALPASARDVLDVVAVAARELPVAVVAAALGTSVAGLHEPLAAALDAGVLREPTPGRLRLAHDLLRDALLADLGPTRRAGLHGALADALTAGAAAATSAAAIAVHRSEAALGGPDDTAARACRAAAEEALGRAADEEALELARRGLGHATAGDPGTVADLQHVAGVAARRLGRLEESRTALAEEARLARVAADPARLTRAAVASAGGGVGGYWTTFAAPFTTDVGLLEEAVEAAAGLEPELQARALAALAVLRSARGEHGAPELATRAEAAAQAAGSQVARRQARVARYVATWNPGTAVERVEIARELLRTAAGHPGFEATALHLLRAALLECGRLAESEAVSRRFAELAGRRHDADLQLLHTWWRVGQHLQRGEHDEARRLADTASGDTPAVSPAAAALARSSRATVEGIAAWHEGRLADLVPAVVDLAATVEPEWLVIQALGQAEAGQHAEARAAVRRLRGVPDGGAREPVRTVLLTEVHVALGDAEGCAALLPALERYGDTVVVLWPGVVALGPTALYRGSALAVLGEVERARTELGRALELAEQLGAAPYAARARQRLAALPGAAATA